MSTKHLNAEEAALKFKEEISGKTVLITGTSPGGIGPDACRAIAKYAKTVILAGRNQEKLKATESEIKKETPGAHLRLLNIDLMSLESVRKAAAEVNATGEPLDVLINGGAVMNRDYVLTADGFESQFGVNYLAAFLLTNLLKPSLAKSKALRVINLSSTGHKLGDVRYEDPGFSKGEKYEKGAAYGQSKTACTLLSVELTKRWKDINATALTVHPGHIQTNLINQMTVEELKAVGIEFGPDGKWVTEVHNIISTSEGAATYIVAAFDPSLTAHSGAYMVECKVANDQASPYALDEAGAKKLWEMSETMVGEKFA